MAETNNKPVSYSRTIITELMLPTHAHIDNKILGDVLFNLMSKAAFACATRHAGSYCVTVSIDDVEFVQPIEVGDFVSFKASVNYVGNTSIIVGIRVESENMKTGMTKHTCSGYFTMVAKDEDGRPTQAPGLILESEDDIRRFLAAMIRKEIKLLGKVQMSDKIKKINVFEDIKKLRKERCEIGFEW
ncbi:MAG: acyl-CoA thioesterase [Thermoflexibacter sp.]|jgi:acyl-CoA hydrolase|nr:acyl-CoA thioesterase [Thermoflexibacter sp.]